jgi:hypothetical protein
MMNGNMKTVDKHNITLKKKYALMGYQAISTRGNLY